VCLACVRLSPTTTKKNKAGGRRREEREKERKREGEKKREGEEKGGKKILKAKFSVPLLSLCVYVLCIFQVKMSLEIMKI
jgi:hypothetical protein